MEDFPMPDGPPAIYLEKLGQRDPIFARRLAEVWPNLPDPRCVRAAASEQSRAERRAPTARTLDEK